MPDVRLFADEQISKAVILCLRQRGIIHAPQSASIGYIICGVLLVTGVLTNDDMKGRVEYL